MQEHRTARIYRLPVRRHRCASCDSHFTPRQPWHRLCRQCFAWARIGAAVMVIKRQLDELRGRP